MLLKKRVMTEFVRKGNVSLLTVNKSVKTHDGKVPVCLIKITYLSNLLIDQRTSHFIQQLNRMIFPTNTELEKLTA